MDDALLDTDVLSEVLKRKNQQVLLTAGIDARRGSLGRWP
jgi:hypothetical protein